MKLLHTLLPRAKFSLDSQAIAPVGAVRMTSSGDITGNQSYSGLDGAAANNLESCAALSPLSHATTLSLTGNP